MLLRFYSSFTSSLASSEAARPGILCVKLMRSMIKLFFKQFFRDDATLFKFILYLSVALYSFSSQAIDYKEYLLLHNSHQCSNYFDHFERKYQIPKHLLRSISIVETGRWHSGAQIYLSWPWAINQGGKSYYMDSKKEAIKKVKQMLEAGLTNIDIGCMQINLHHHPEAFSSLNDAFEPKNNIEYAANFLLNNYNLSQNWQQAIAIYHSQASIGRAYANKVLKRWSEYNENKLNSTYCNNVDGGAVPCNNATTTASISQKETKEELPLENLNDKTEGKETLSKSKMDPKRLKSSMILYSIHNE